MAINKQNKKAVIVLLVTSCLALGVWFYSSEDISTNIDTPVPEQTIKDTEPVAQHTENTPDCQTKKRCAEFSSCEAARSYLIQCQSKALDRDHDGVPCEGTLCEHQ